jgi:hypothetical protein
LLLKETGVLAKSNYLWYFYINKSAIHFSLIYGSQRKKEMNAEDFYKMYKKGKRMENEYFIAVDKVTLFEMMEAYAEMKTGINTSSFLKKKTNSKRVKIIEHN